VSNPDFGISTPKVDYALRHFSRESDRLSFQGAVLAAYTRPPGHPSLFSAKLHGGSRKHCAAAEPCLNLDWKYIPYSSIAVCLHEGCDSIA
jgi:hypothetical protein